MAKTGNRCMEPEIHRVRGELVLTGHGHGIASGGAARDAERYFRRAGEIARLCSARSLELRAATNLARLCHTQGEDIRARRLLAHVCDWFTEGADTADLRAARHLLSMLESPSSGHRGQRVKRGVSKS